MSRQNRVYIIAEAGVNHNGSLNLAFELVDAAAEAGADAVKFQTFKADKLVSKSAAKADYQKKTTAADESQYEMIRRLELDEAAHHQIIERCRLRNIQFLSTPFDTDSMNLLVTVFHVPFIKFSSGDITNAPLLLQAAKTGRSIILSTGMSTMAEVEQALSVLAYGYTCSGVPLSSAAFETAYSSEEGQKALKEKVTLLHCTTEYPAPFHDVNLKAMDTLYAAFQLKVGYSDHTPGIAVPLAAAARGACMIEKHFTMSKALPGPDHKASLEPNELKEMVESIRQIERAIGHPIKVPAPSEIKNKSIARKSIVAATPIAKGDIFTVSNLTVKRPGDGLAPILYWDLLGKRADRDYEEDGQVVL